MYLLINSFFPFVRWKLSLSREPHLLAGIPVSWKLGYHILSSNDTHVFQGQGKRYARFQGEPTFSPQQWDHKWDECDVTRECENTKDPDHRRAVRIRICSWRTYTSLAFYKYVPASADVQIETGGRERPHVLHDYNYTTRLNLKPSLYESNIGGLG